VKYRSKPTEIEAMQWSPANRWSELPAPQYTADQIVAWVNANGGEARYENHWEGDRDRAQGQRLNRIAVRTINGWAHAAPGHYVVMGSATFDIDMLRDPKDPRCAEHNIPDCVYCPTEAVTVRDFYPCDQETFEKRWEPQSTERSEQ
jgi:hypothetical protein